MNALLVAPIAVPLALAALGIALGPSRRRVHEILAVVSAAAVFASGVGLLSVVRAGGIQTIQLGGWAAPFGITLVADLFSSLLVCVAGLLAFSVVLYSLVVVDPEQEVGGYFPLIGVLIAGVCGAFLAGDLFNLFVWFEVLLIASFVLLALGESRAQLEGGVKYVALNLLASALFLAAVGVIYGFAGTLNLADLGRQVTATAESLPWRGVATLLLIAFGIKAALFPLFFWLPDSYYAPPVPVTALFAGLMSKVGLYALIRTWGTVFGIDAAFSGPLLLALGCLTMVTGVLGAVAQYDLRRLLAFHIISQVGYVAVGLGLRTQEALSAALAFMIHIILAKSALFLVGGVAERIQGTSELKRMGGLYRARPLLSVLFLVPALSLAGLPPFSGFFAKFALVRSALRGEAFAVAAVAMGVGVLTLFSMMKIWREAFWKESPESLPVTGAAGPLLLIPCVLIGVWTLLLGLFAQPLFALTSEAAAQILDRDAYQRIVLGGS